MKRIACLALALTLLLLQGAAAVRMCACLDAIDTPSCCKQEMPCCEGGECKMHPDSALKADLALDLLKSLDAAAALPLLGLPEMVALAHQEPEVNAPPIVRVRGPDTSDHALRAPPVRT
jgi:hypothetical protein